MALVEVESAFDFKAITTHDLIAPHTISGLANAKLHAIMVKYRGVTAHAILSPVASRGAGERSDIGELQPLLHACHEAHHDLFVSVLLAGGAGIRDIDFNLLRFETYTEQLRRAGVSEVPAAYRDPMALSPSQLGCLHVAALKGGAEREQLSYYTMAQLKTFESKGKAALGARHAHPAPTRARLHGPPRLPRDATRALAGCAAAAHASTHGGLTPHARLSPCAYTGVAGNLSRFGKTEESRKAELQDAVANASSTCASGSSTVDYDSIGQPELRGLYAALRKEMDGGECLPKSVDMRKAGGDDKIKIALRMRDAAKSVDDILVKIQ